MTRLILLIVFFALSLLCVCKAPEYHLWYVSILVTEFSWVFLPVVAFLLLLGFKTVKYSLPGTIFGLISLGLLLIPIIGAYRIGSKLSANINNAFSSTSASHEDANVFSARRMLTGIGAPQVPYVTMPYAAGNEGPLTLDFYGARATGKSPCIIVVHGGSWSGGDSRQLPELNSCLALAGYNVASINYRLAPKNIFPAPTDDVRAALNYLRMHAVELSVDMDNIILLGRSAGGQIVLQSAYTLHDAGIKGVINFYGPTDMVWGYAHPANPLVLNTCKVMEDYLGGTYAQVPQQYVASSGTSAIGAVYIPTLTIHGKNDPLVAYEHSELLEQRLQTVGVKHFLLSLPWATHGCDYSLNSASGQLSTFSVLRFLSIVTGK